MLTASPSQLCPAHSHTKSSKTAVRILKAPRNGDMEEHVRALMSSGPFGCTVEPYVVSSLESQLTTC